MITFPVQLDSFRISKIGERTLVFHTYQEHAEEVSKITNEPMGTEYLLMLIPTKSKEMEEFRDETPEESKERFRKRMNSLISQVSELEGVKTEQFRESFKTELKEKGFIINSTKELTLEGYAKVIGILNEKIYGRKKITRN